MNIKSSKNLSRHRYSFQKSMNIETRERRILEQMLSNEHDVYSVEDDIFLYYCRENRLHVVKGNADYSMTVSGWEEFAKTLLRVNDEYFLTGKGSRIKEQSGFLGGYISKYSRRKEFANGLLEIIADARLWNYV